MRNRDQAALARARELRNYTSRSEKVLWDHLRNKKTGFRFRRQYPVGHYVLDFYCPKLRLCIELDGPQHQNRTARDAKRDEILAIQRISTLRIRTDALHEHFAEVEEAIRVACLDRDMKLSQEPPSWGPLSDE